MTTKLMATLLVVSALSMTLMVHRSYRAGQKALQDNIFDQLTGLRSTRARQIETHFDEVARQVATIAEDPTTAAATRAFAQGFTDPKDRQFPHTSVRLGAVDAPSGDDDRRSGAHETYHSAFEAFADGFGFEDVYLVGGPGLDVVYSVGGAPEVGTSLRTGPHRGSSFAAAVAEAAATPQRGATFLSDFSPHRPEGMTPSAFVATPILDGPHAVGVLAVRLSIAEMDRIMTNDQAWIHDGLGESGEIYLVGDDFLMRSSSRFMLEDPDGYIAMQRRRGRMGVAGLDRLEMSRTTILNQPVRSSAAQAAIRHGEVGTDLVQDYRGVSVLSSYGPLRVLGVEWAIFAEMDEVEAFAAVYRIRRSVLQTLIIIIVVVTLAAMVLSWDFVRPAAHGVASARRVARGNVGGAVPRRGADEATDLAAALDQVVQTLRQQDVPPGAADPSFDRLTARILHGSSIDRGADPTAVAIVDVARACTVVWVKIDGLVRLADRLDADTYHRVTEGIFARLDEVAVEHGGGPGRRQADTYVVVVGLPRGQLDHDRRGVELAFGGSRVVDGVPPQYGLSVRVGVGTGALTAAVFRAGGVAYQGYGAAAHLARRAMGLAPRNGVATDATTHDQIGTSFDSTPIGDDPVAWHIRRRRTDG